MPERNPDKLVNNARRYWRIETVVWADDAQVENLCQDIAQVLCPDPDHPPPCAIPWDMSRCELAVTDPAVESLREQVAIEYPGTARESSEI